MRDVKSRQVMDPFFEEVRLFLVPVFHGLKGSDVAQRLLRDVLIIDLDVAFNGSGRMLGGAEAGSGQDVGDAPVEAFDHAIGLRAAGLG